jgi:hypothetical protein
VNSHALITSYDLLVKAETVPCGALIVFMLADLCSDLLLLTTIEVSSDLFHRTLGSVHYYGKLASKHYGRLKFLVFIIRVSHSFFHQEFYVQLIDRSHR